MDRVIIAVLGVAGVGLLLIVGSIIGALCGALSGWIMGIVFDETMHKLLVDILNMPYLAPWEAGAMLGWLGGFIRSSCTNTNS